MKELAQSFWNHFWTFLGPRQFYAWQSALWLSVLAWVLSRITRSPVQLDAPITAYSILITFSWIFLIIAVGWFTTEYPIKIFGQNLGPWLTGILVCLFLFDRGEAPLVRPALLSWPLISTAIAAFPDFVKVDSGFTVPRGLQTRQRLVVLLLANLLLTSWIFLGLRIQTWFEQYPGLRGERFNESLVVMEPWSWQPDYRRADAIVEEMSNQLVQDTTGVTVPEVERWLMERRENPYLFRDAVMNQLAKNNSDRRLDQEFWQLRTLVSEPDGTQIAPLALGSRAEYQVTLQAIWTGPHSHQDGHGRQLQCQINVASSNRTQVVCDRDIKAKQTESQT